MTQCGRPAKYKIKLNEADAGIFSCETHARMLGGIRIPVSGELCEAFAWRRSETPPDKDVLENMMDAGND